MSAGQETSSDKKPWHRDLLSIGGLANLVAVLAFLGGVFFAASTTIQRNTTQPIAGYTDILVPEEGEDCPVFIRSWKVYNPGPADLPGTVLEVDVADKCDLTTHQFISGLVITKGPGVSYTIENNGAGHRILFVPSGKQLRHWHDFTCQFHIRESEWKATDARVTLPGNVTFDANVPFDTASPSTGTYWWPISLMFFGAFILLFNRLRDNRDRKMFDEHVRSALDRETPNIIAAALIEFQQTLQDANPERLRPPSSQQLLGPPRGEN